MPDIFVADDTNPQESENIPPAKNAFFANIPLQNRVPKPIAALASFSELPKGVIFDMQQETETILLFLRRDLITNVPWIIATILLLFVPFILMFALGLAISPFSFLPPNTALIVEIFYYLAITTYAFVNFMTWYFNISLVTNQRVMDIDFADIVYKNVAVTTIDRVKDVTFIQTGVIRTMFDYGDVYVKVEGDDHNNFDFESVPRPAHVVEIIESIMRKDKNG